MEYVFQQNNANQKAKAVADQMLHTQLLIQQACRVIVAADYSVMRMKSAVKEQAAEQVAHNVE
jgi:hypothetical protein